MMICAICIENGSMSVTHSAVEPVSEPVTMTISSFYGHKRGRNVCTGTAAKRVNSLAANAVENDRIYKSAHL